jgi:hypothetical protein
MVVAAWIGASAVGLGYTIAIQAGALALAGVESAWPSGCLAIICQLLSALALCFWGVGSVRVLLKAARGKHVGLVDLFSGRNRAVKLLGLGLRQIAIALPAGLGIAGVVWLLPFGVGVVAAFVMNMMLIFLMLPGFLFAPFLVVDRGLGPIAALRLTWKLLKTRIGDVALFYFLAGCVEGLGLLACGLGIVPATAITGVAAAHLYLATVGEEDETLVRV